jgi:hypothetical protein
MAVKTVFESFSAVSFSRLNNVLFWDRTFIRVIIERIMIMPIVSHSVSLVPMDFFNISNISPSCFHLVNKREFKLYLKLTSLFKLLGCILRMNTMNHAFIIATPGNYIAAGSRF